MITFFDSIPRINSYSHYGASLEKMFKMSSLKYFIKTLKFKEEFHKKYLKEDTVNKKKKEYDIYEMEGIQLNRENNKEDIFSLPDTNSINNNNNNKIINNYEINKSYFYRKKNNSSLSESPDALKYNPNYKSISKNIPSVRIVKPLYDKNKRALKKTNLLNLQLKKDINKIVLKETNSNKYLNTLNNDSHQNFKNSSIINRYNTIEPTIREKRFITEIPIKNNKNFFKNKSCKKYPYKLPHIWNSDFPHYMLEKSANKNRIRKFNVNSNSISFYNRNRAVDFRKMLKRSSKNFINVSSLKVPNSGYYEPNYNAVEERQYDILFDKPIIDENQKKQLLLKKIMTSYYIEPNYQLIDNSKLNDEALKRLNL